MCIMSLDYSQKAVSGHHSSCFLDEVAEAQLRTVLKFPQLAGVTFKSGNQAFRLQSLCLKQLQTILLLGSASNLLCDLEEATFPLWT